MSESPPQTLSLETRRRMAGVVIVGVALALVFAAIGLRTSAHVPGGLEGKVAPVLALPVITPKPRREVITYQVPGRNKHPLLVHFWGPSCAPCLKELPIIDRLYREGADGQGNWEVVTITGEDTAEVRVYLGAHPTTFPVLQDADGSAHEGYRISTIPASFVITPDGVIHRELIGAQTYETLAGLLREVDLPPAASATTR